MPVGWVESVQGVNQGRPAPPGSTFAGPPQAELSVRVDEVELLPLDDAVDGPLSHQPEADSIPDLNGREGKRWTAGSCSSPPGLATVQHHDLMAAAFQLVLRLNDGGRTPFLVGR